MAEEVGEGGGGEAVVEVEGCGIVRGESGGEEGAEDEDGEEEEADGGEGLAADEGGAGCFFGIVLHGAMILGREGLSPLPVHRRREFMLRLDFAEGSVTSASFDKGFAGTETGKGETTRFAAGWFRLRHSFLDSRVRETLQELIFL